MGKIPILAKDNLVFPPIESALREPEGLLAVGGDLSIARLTAAYQQGIFPWFDDEQPILWWCPDPRTVLFPQQFKPSRSLTKLLRKNYFDVSINSAFDQVIDACSETRKRTSGTWITADMKVAYKAMHSAGLAHSIECYRNGLLVGGLYGIGIGNLFFGESMFHRETNASKVAFAYLARLMRDHKHSLIDCQIGNQHLTTLGAVEISRKEFLRYLKDFKRKKEIDWLAIPADLPPWEILDNLPAE
ncbi:MAG: leucyl/phenylalanyl-tRNA--protein transferase [Candidatus Azotimanducaceae bacterium]|uniref:Leucyl/phenylalanyl-tRNA--protein transferase n=1 Tax=OM182 bacterium TaxID=2510334 RepID=A0A520RYQ4_9GAMM|nr:leucyl/phenylalanyl-tRNA--protein transferase [Gammaproteobacteria bacterium]OUV67823.1 MAG: leucyl/phenylalanyl-tRNA--protein transferase [Gammaproteobacteria bacterium TMED133]RZO75373.1 MAG: leucyl/phenylalanyl-tRNA--protein transferase [OM182 bacterium]